MTASTHFSELAAQPLITAEQISHRYGDKWVLKEISLQVRKGEILTLIGPNGAGKSTLIQILLGLIQPSQGKVVRAKDLVVGFMPQKISIDHTFPITVHRFLTLGKPIQASQTDFQAHLQQISQELKIQPLHPQPVQSLSGGEMQRVLLARALMRKPNLLVLDEPVQGVDIHGQSELYHYLTEIRDRYHCGIIMVSHDLHLVMRSTDEVLCLNQHLCCHGRPHAVAENPIYAEIFGEAAQELALYEHHHGEACQHAHGIPDNSQNRKEPYHP